MGIADSSAEVPPESGTESYLVVRKGSAWREIYRLTPESVMTIGRDLGNRIVLVDDRCSRQHGAVYHEGTGWWIRDLGSRNGTTVAGATVRSPVPLADGATIEIGGTRLLFTHEISRPLDEMPAATNATTREVRASELGLDGDSNPVILDRKSHPRFITESALSGESGAGPSVREAFATLYRLIVGMMSSASVKEVCETVLAGLLPAVDADIGAVLLFPDRTEDRTNPANLRIVAYQAPEQSPYRRVSSRLSKRVLEAGEALLARGISAEKNLVESGSLRELEATSVICAPIRSEGRVRGVLHIYSRHSHRQMDANALELVLAVGDHLATILGSLNQKDALAASLRRVEGQNKSLSQLLEIESDLIGDSAPMRALRDSIARVAASDAIVLIRGESGVGKELVARAVHFNSERREGPFVCVNCAALTETLLESELFGHEKGAFTGASNRKLGKFEQADGGTLFLDEVGEMPVAIQAKFLRVLEGQSFERVGGHTSIRVDVRIVAATNRNLESAVEEGQFRRDLLYRLQVIELRPPRLCEHADDIPVLAQHLLDRTCRRLGRPVMQFTQGGLDKLCSYAWPGNVRELRNVIERAVVLHPGTEISEAELLFTPSVGADAAGSSSAPDQAPVSLEEVERRHILHTLETNKWNKRETARLLGINRSTLDRKLQKYEVEGKES